MNFPPLVPLTWVLGIAAVLVVVLLLAALSKR
jgi:hypothetical protein